MKVTVLAESSISFLQILSAPAMSTDMSQVGVVLFPCFKYFLSFHLSRFFFYIDIFRGSLKFLNMATCFQELIYDDIRSADI